MRKGRSSRKGRTSRPAIAPSAADRKSASSIEALSGEVSVRTPRVVVGVPPSDPPPAEAPTPSTPETPSTPSALRADRASKLGGDTLRDDRPPAFEDTVADPTPSAEQAQQKQRIGDATILLGSRTGELEGDAPANTQRSRESAASVPAAAPAAVATSKSASTSESESESAHEHEEHEDDEEHEDHEEHEEKFFSEGDLVAKVPEAAASEEPLTVADEAKRRAAPEVVERRVRFIGYVRWAVGGALLVCLAAAGRAAFSSKAPAAPSSPHPAITAEAPPAPKAAEITAEPSPSAVSTAPPPAPAAEPSAAPAESVAAAESAAPATSAAPAESASAVPPPGDGKTAKEEKAEARTLLERRKIDLAIEAGERSVALDPTDGEAWLILGAAYQERGRLADARKAYASCVKDGKTGPRHECMKMLR